MRSDPLEVPVALLIGKGMLRKVRQNLGWAVGYNVITLAIAAGIFVPIGFHLTPEIAAISMAGSSVIVATDALLLNRFRLPKQETLKPIPLDIPAQIPIEVKKAPGHGLAGDLAFFSAREPWRRGIAAS